MTTENIDIRIREDGSRVVTRNIQDIGTASDRSAGSVDLLKKALGYLTAVLAIDKIRQYADAWSNASGLINVATKSTEEQIAVQEKLFAVAQKTRTSFTDVVDLYARAARAGAELGASQAQVIKFTEGVGKVLVIQHTSATQAAGSLLQLGQLLGQGKVRAQEFNSVNENLSTVLKIVAQNVKGADGSIAKLRQQLNDGKLTSKQFFDAFLAGSDTLDKNFEKSSHTIGQALTVVVNAFTKYIGELDHSIGSSETLNKIAKFIAENMNQLATILRAVGAAVLVAFAPGYIAAFAASVGRLFALLYANPFGALAVIVAGLAVYFSQLGDEILSGVDDITSINDVFRSFGETATAALLAVLGVAQDVFTTLVDLASSAYDSINESTGNAATSWKQDFNDFYADTGSGFAGVLRAVAKTLDAIGGLLIGLAIGVYKSINGIPDLFKEVFNRAYNVVVGTIEDMINVVIGGVNKLRGFVGAEPIELVKFAKLETDVAAFQKYGQGIGNAIDEGFQAQGGALLKSVDNVFARAQEIAKDRISKIKPPTAVDLNVPIGKPTKIVDSKEIDKITNALRSLLNTIFPSAGAVLELAKSHKTLTDALSHGLITQQEFTKYTELAKAHYEDIINPLGKVNRELGEQTTLLGYNNRERAIESQLLGVQKDLKQQGIILSQSETTALRERFTALRDLTEVVTAQDQLLQGSVDKRREFTTQLVAIQNLLKDPTSGFTKSDANTAINGSNSDILGNTQSSLDAQVAAYEDMYSRINQLRSADLISEATAAQAKQQVDIQYNQFRLKSTTDIFTNLASLSTSGNKRLAAIGKAAAVTTATIDGVIAVQKALAAPPGWPYNAATVISVGIQAAANVAKLAGFEEGGYTGSAGRSNVAGVVHGQEFVVHADATAKNRSALEAMNRGQTVGDTSGGTVVSIVVNNKADGTKATATERDTPTGKQIEIMVENVVKKQVRNGGPIADTLEAQYSLNRAAGTVR